MSENPDRTPVAQDVFTYCTKEKIETWHVVMAQNAAGIVDRVVCKSCKSEHKYKKKEVAKVGAIRKIILRKPSKPETVSMGKPAQLSAAAADEQWFKGVKAWGDKSPKGFDPSVHFVPGDVVEHDTFGKGVVQGRRESRVDVLFKEAGLKTLPSKLNS